MMLRGNLPGFCPAGHGGSWVNLGSKNSPPNTYEIDQNCFAWVACIVSSAKTFGKKRVAFKQS